MKGLGCPILDYKPTILKLKDVNKQDEIGRTPLHHAVWACVGTLEIEVFLRNGANARIRDRFGQSPRDLAISLSESGKTLLSFPGESNYMAMQFTKSLENRNLLQQVERGYDVCESVLIVIYFTLRKHRGFYKDVAQLVARSIWATRNRKEWRLFR